MVELLEYRVGRLYKLVVGGKRIRKLSRAAEELFKDFATVGLGQCLKGLQQMAGCLSHGSLFYAAGSLGITQSTTIWKLRGPGGACSMEK
ncbi:MAG: hypothetical protein ACT4P4_12665 [Betaproteobacteria bacterium]